ncbi:MAG: metallopeptidase TldD-related protein [Pseudomonadota bacterium]
MSQNSADPLDPARADALAADALAAAKTAGADAADAVVLASRSLSATVRNGTIEEAVQSEETEIGLRVFVGDRSALVMVGAPSGLAAAAERAVAMAKAAPEDATQAIAPANLLTTSIPSDLEIYDPTTQSMDALIERARALEAVMQHVPGVTNSGGVSASAAHAVRALATSNGFAQTYATSTHSHSATAVAGAGTKMERDYWFSSRRHLADLEPIESVGKIAGERAVRSLGGEAISTRNATIVFEPRAATGFVGHLIGAINGSAVARGATLLAGKIGERVFPQGITVTDDPGLVRGQASRPFDHEGLANKALNLVADGVLKQYILDLQSARKLGLTSNGRARRGTGAPSPGSTNIAITGGSGDLQSIMNEVGSGLLVTSLIGMGANIVNGNYSRGAAGFWFENGEVQQPVAEITIAGNLADMFARARFGDDAPGMFATNAPTVAIEGLTIGGR